MQHSSLTELRAQYACGRLDRKILEGLIFQYLLDNVDRYRLFSGNRDKWADFIGWLYPRLSRAVDLYKDTGSTFDKYISSIILWSSKEYKAREAEHKTTELACWKARAEEMEARSPEPEYYNENRKCYGRSKSKILFPLMNMSPRQILILFLKSYYFVTREFLEKVAETIGMEKENLQAMIDNLHSIREKKEAKIHLQKERIYSQYYRCLAFQKRLSTALPGTARYEKIKDYIDRAQIKYTTMKRRFSRMKIDATNQEIAEIMEIPKGTVDSAIFNIRERYHMTVKQPILKVPQTAPQAAPIAGNENEGYHKTCSATATFSTQAMPQMS